jgi:hypothetical protein
MNEYKDIPQISKQLTEWLLRMFPNESPNENESYGQLMVRAGAAKVVNKIIHEYNEQNK